MTSYIRSSDQFTNAIKNSLKGFKTVWNSEVAFREYLLISSVLIPLAVYFGENSVERVLLIMSVLLVLLMELLNTAIEAVVDRIGEEDHPLSGAAKDIGSAVVMLSIITMVMTWLLILL